MPISFCAEVAPVVLRMADLEDPYVKVQAYLTLEVLFASRRFQNTDVVHQRILKTLLENPEIIQSMAVDT